MAISYETGFISAVCPQLQQSLLDIARENAGQINRTPVGFTDSLISDYNRAGFQAIQVNDEYGHKKTVRVLYIQPTDASEILTSRPDVCAATIKTEPNAQIIDVRRERYTTPKILTEADMRLICYSTMTDYKAAMIYGMIDGLMTSVNNDLLSIMAANFGNHFNSTNAAVNATLINNNAPHAIGFAGLMEEYSNIRGVRRPITVGSGILSVASRLLSIGCCNDLGISLDAINGEYLFFRDNAVNTIIGLNQFALYSPGSLQLLTYNENSGSFRKIGDTFVHDTIVDPFTGMVFDIQVEYDSCNKVYKMMLHLNYDLYFLPNNMYPVGSDMEGVNGTLRFQAVQA